jgi:hypothetical protein
MRSEHVEKRPLIPVEDFIDRLFAGPFTHADRGDDIGSFDELVPSFASCIEDGLAAIDCAVREEVGAQVLPDIFHRVQLRRT